MTKSLRQQVLEAIWHAIDPSQEGVARDCAEHAKAEIEALPVGVFADEVTTWQPITETTPVSRRVLVRVPIEKHRIVIGLLTKDGLWLDERLQPIPFVPTEWQELPK